MFKLPLPTPHYMMLAPLDVWLRLLFCPLAHIRPKYWVRLFAVLFTSTLATIITLPERILLGLWLSIVPFRPKSLPGPVIVLGYYRSGTTHLHYLLDCDPQLFTPKWFHALVPQGFVVSWSFLRLFLIPFMSGRRPMDAMDVGPEFAAEDHFGVNNWCLASTLPGKTVLPESAAFYDRFNRLQEVTPAELSRWRRYQLAFIRKLALVAGGRRLLLKSPSHTAHVDRLLELFADVPGVKFVHITRQPDKVLRSNVWMHQVFQKIWNLQDPMPQEAMEENLLAEYLASEESYLQARGRIPAGQLAEIRIQDLHSDPLGTMRRIYAQWDLPFTPQFEQRLLEYLEATSDFQPNQHIEWNAEQEARLKPRLAPIVEKFRHNEPAIAKVKPPKPDRSVKVITPARQLAAAALALVVGAVCAMAWLGVLNLDGDHYRQYYRLVWPAGLAIGFTALRAAGSGCSWLGAWAAFVSLAVLLAMAFHSTRWIQFAGQSQMPLADLCWATVEGLLTFHALFWLAVGLVSAYRLGARVT